MVPRKPEAQIEKTAGDIDQRLEIGPSGGKIVREAKMAWGLWSLGLKWQTRDSRLEQGNHLFLNSFNS